MQKLVTIYLKDVDADGDFIPSGLVEEHLVDELQQGWEVDKLSTLSGNGGGKTDVSAGWVIALMSK